MLNAYRDNQSQLQIPELPVLLHFIILLFLEMESIKKALYLVLSFIVLMNQDVPYEFEHSNASNN